MLTRPLPAKGTFNTPEYRAAVADFTEEAFDVDSPEMQQEIMAQEALDAAATARPDLTSQPSKLSKDRATPAKATPAKTTRK